MLDLLMKPFAAAGAAIGSLWDALWGGLYGFGAGAVVGIGSRFLPRNWVSSISDVIHGAGDMFSFIPGVGEWLKSKVNTVGARLEMAADSDSWGHAAGHMGVVGASVGFFKELLQGFTERMGSHLQPMTYQTRDPRTNQVVTRTSAGGVMNNTVVGLGALITGGIIYSLMKNGVSTARPANPASPLDTIAFTPTAGDSTDVAPRI